MTESTDQQPAEDTKGDQQPSPPKGFHIIPAEDTKCDLKSDDGKQHVIKLTKGYSYWFIPHDDGTVTLVAATDGDVYNELKIPAAVLEELRAIKQGESDQAYMTRLEDELWGDI